LWSILQSTYWCRKAVIGENTPANTHGKELPKPKEPIVVGFINFETKLDSTKLLKMVAILVQP
jgi:hypothetical protein